MKTSDPTRNEGTVVKEHLGRYFVQTDEGLTVCSLSSMLRKTLIYPLADPASIRPHVVSVEEIKAVDLVAIGDEVRFDPAGDGTGVIKEVLPRRTKLSRRAAGSKPLEHVLVANVDQIVPVFAARSPSPKLRMLDRFLAAGEWEGLEAVICINKMDLVDEEAFRREMGVYEQIGYPVIYTSALEGSGLDDFKHALRDKLSILVGPSGVGKSSLLNAVQPGLGLRVREISQTQERESTPRPIWSF